MQGFRVRRDADNESLMFDALTSRYTFPCPGGGEARVTLSDFRELTRLPGTAHPAVFRVRFACRCGEEHLGLVSHDELDWAPLGLGGGAYLNLMTSRMEAVAEELSDVAASRIQAGQWPWSFFCYPEDRPRPVYPSAFFLLAPGGGSLGLAVRCPACAKVSVNVVSEPHVDVPFHHDHEVGVVEYLFGDDPDALVREFAEELDSGAFDVRRMRLAA